jgi:hypothetical protein
VKIYLAARYSRHPEMREVRDWLEQRGHKVTSRWIDCHGDSGSFGQSWTAETLNETPWVCSGHALDDVADVLAADWVISFTGGGGKGGRHTEFGIGVASDKRLIIVGSREHVFHTLPQVEHYPDWPTLQATLDGGA